jgi:hypothetical protein
MCICLFIAWHSRQLLLFVVTFDQNTWFSQFLKLNWFDIGLILFLTTHTLLLLYVKITI